MLTEQERNAVESAIRLAKESIRGRTAAGSSERDAAMFELQIICDILGSVGEEIISTDPREEDGTF